MKAKEPKTIQREPVGNLCVVRDDSLGYWSVFICPGTAGERKALKHFSTRSEAEAFADGELTKLNAAGGEKKYILHVDDCPCWQRQL